jgi:hypothetical protein
VVCTVKAGLRLEGLGSGDMMLFPAFPAFGIHAVAFIRPSLLMNVTKSRITLDSKSSNIGIVHLNCKLASFQGQTNVYVYLPAYHDPSQKITKFYLATFLKIDPAFVFLLRSLNTWLKDQSRHYQLTSILGRVSS